MGTYSRHSAARHGIKTCDNQEKGGADRNRASRGRSGVSCGKSAFQRSSDRGRYKEAGRAEIPFGQGDNL